MSTISQTKPSKEISRPLRCELKLLDKNSASFHTGINKGSMDMGANKKEVNNRMSMRAIGSDQNMSPGLVSKPNMKPLFINRNHRQSNPINFKNLRNTGSEGCTDSDIRKNIEKNTAIIA